MVTTTTWSDRFSTYSPKFGSRSALRIGALRRYGEDLLTFKGIEFANRVYGLLETGSMTEEYLLGLIPQIKADLVEIYSHPAIVNDGEPLNGPIATSKAELTALLSKQVHEVLIANNFELTNYVLRQGKGESFNSYPLSPISYQLCLVRFQ